MIGTFSLAVAAALAAVEPVAGADLQVRAMPNSDDGILVADVLSDQELALTMRGTTVKVLATAVPAEGGCAARISARAAGSSRRWTRLLRWNEIAWLGTNADGSTVVTFYDPDGHLPVDTMAFRPIDEASFLSGLTRVMASCRASFSKRDRVMNAGVASARGCHFARMPGLQLFDGSAPTRAILTLLSRESSEAELQVLLESPARDRDASDEDAPLIALNVADARLKDMKIAEAAFALDSQGVAVRYSIAAYGDTRLRIRLDGLVPPVDGAASGVFLRRLASAREVTLTLLDRDRQARAAFHFDLGSVLAEAHEAVDSASWSCSHAAPAPAPAATWEPVR